MEYILLFFAMSSSAILSIMSSLFGRYNKSEKNTSFLYSMIVTFSAFITWGVIGLQNSEVNFGVILHSVAYGFFYTLAMIGMFKAYQSGPVSLTAFVKQLSLIAVAFWGFVFWDNHVTTNILIGIMLVIIALYLCFKHDKVSDKKVVSIKWCLFALMLLIGNAGCSIIQKYQQIAFDGKYGNIFMFFGSFISFAICLFMYMSKDGCKIKDVSKHTVIYPVVGGISSGVLNLLILLLISSTLSESIIFPGIAVGGLIITMIFSLIAYHEKIRPVQWCGFVIGFIALILLNL